MQQDGGAGKQTEAKSIFEINNEKAERPRSSNPTSRRKLSQPQLDDRPKIKRSTTLRAPF